MRVFRTLCVWSLAEDVIQGGVRKSVYLMGNCLNVILVCWRGSAHKVFLAAS